MRKHTLLAAAACTATVLGLTGAVPAGAATAAAPVPAKPRTADFNGDGHPDLAVTATKTTVAGHSYAGTLAVRYGSPTGLGKTHLIDRDTTGVIGLPAPSDEFGRLIGHGDVDGDGYDDLLVRSAPMLAGSDIPKNPNGVVVLRGSKDGITGRNSSFVDSGPLSSSQPYNFYPQAVADVTGDGIVDLLSSGSKDGKGGLVVFEGPLSRETDEPAAVRFTPVTGMNPYGSVFAADMTGDGITDVIAGTLSGSSYKGTLLKGSASGFTPAGSIPHIHGSTAFGDLNKDGYLDFVGGDGGSSTTIDGGRIYITYGGPNGVGTTLPTAVLTQDSPGVPGLAEAGDRFGRSLAIGDTNGDGYEDIVVGAPFETGSDAAVPNSGSVTVLRGGPQGIATTGNQVLTQDSSGVPSTSERKDYFGSQVRVIDTDKDGKPEVHVAGYGEDGLKGRVWKLNTGTSGVTGTGATSYNLAELGGPAGRADFGGQLVG